MKDKLGVVIRHRDRVLVERWSQNRRDTVPGPHVSPILAIGSSRIVVLDPEGNQHSVKPDWTRVLRRDGEPGFEGNRSANDIAAI